MGYKKAHNELKKLFYWKDMFTMCKEIWGVCEFCVLLKVKMNLEHKYFSTKLFCTHRISYDSDYYEVRKNTSSYCQILDIIDLETGHLVLKSGNQVSVTHVTHTLYNDIIVKKGVPLLFHSDTAKVFVGTAMETLSNTLGINQTNSLTHNPKSNVKCGSSSITLSNQCPLSNTFNSVFTSHSLITSGIPPQIRIRTLPLWDWARYVYVHHFSESYREPSTLLKVFRLTLTISPPSLNGHVKCIRRSWPMWK